MKTEGFASFEEFWPFYVHEHKNKTTRTLHAIGTTTALVLLAGGILTKKKWMFAAAPVAGYGFAWFSHFFIEHNKPATFKHPLWSLRGDFVMLKKILEGTMDEEVERVLREMEEAEAAPVTVQGDATVN